VYSGGWVRAAGGDAAVIEPATGAELGRTGIGGPADIASAARQAAAAQQAWAARPHSERSALLRKAADIWLANAARSSSGAFRESGKIGPLPSSRHTCHQRAAIIDDGSGTRFMPWSRRPSAPGLAWRPAGPTRACSTGRRPGGRHGGHAGLRQRGLRPGRPVLKFGSADDVAEIAARSEYGLSLGILTRDVMRGLDLARRIPSGIVHINEADRRRRGQHALWRHPGLRTGARFGGAANVDAFTETRWVTIRGDIAPYPF